MGICWFIPIFSTAAFQPTSLLHGCRMLNYLLCRRFFLCCGNSPEPHNPYLFSASADTTPLSAFFLSTFRALGLTFTLSRLHSSLVRSTSCDTSSAPGSAACASLSVDPPCHTCASPVAQPCLFCDHPFCSRHLYQCADCQIAFCGNCFDLHNLEGHWSDSDTALALERSLYRHSHQLCAGTSLQPSPGSTPPRAFVRRCPRLLRVTLGALFSPQ